MIKTLLNCKNSEPSSLFLRLTLLFVFFLGACQPQSSPLNQLVFSGPIMGTDYRVTVIVEGQHKEQIVKQLEASVVAAMDGVNQSMSNYLSDSELSQFNRLAADQTQLISDEFAAVVKEALEISELSAGAFDITLGKAIDAWGFGPEGSINKQPTAQKLSELKARVGYQNLILEDNTLSKRIDGIELSLSAIAKGYAVDQVARALKQQGINDFLVNIGGELRSSGKSLDGKLWRVGIEKPHILGGIQRVAKLDNQAIATSGDYRNYLVIDNQRFSHTIDPATLSPVYHKLALVSVIADKASTADALATALLAMGEIRAWEFVKLHDLAAYLVIRGQADNQYQIKISDKFSRNLQ